MKIIQYVVFAFIIIFLNNCNISKSVSEKNILIELEKTLCSGKCPTFSVKIATNGLVIYEGKENVDKIGIYKSKLSKDQLNELTDKFNKANFFSFKNSYKSSMMDLPTKFITYSKNGQKKRIKAYDNIPKEISYLIKQVDKLIESLEWKKID
jgi:hypothetical protein